MKTFPCHQFLAALLAFGAVAPARAQLSVEWLTQYGTSNFDSGSAVAVDASGQIWVSGNTSGSLGGPSAGGNEHFLSRLSPGGTLDFTRQRSGTSLAFGIALVGSNAVFVGSTTLGSTSIDGQAALGGFDGLAVRYDTNGTWQGTTRIGGSSDDTTYGLAGNATHLLVAGFTRGSFNGHTNEGYEDAYLSKRDSSGSVVWTRFVGTSGSELGESAFFDGDGNAYLAGSTGGSFSGFTNAGGSDLFLARYDTAGSRTLLWQFGTGEADIVYDVEVDGGGNIYLTGATSGALGGETNAGNSDAFVMKLDSMGNVLWTRLLGGSSIDQSSALGVDGSGHVWIGGHSYSTFGGHSNAGSLPDAFVAEYDSDGLLVGTIFFDTGQVAGIAIGPDGAAYVTGHTEGVLGASNLGRSDVFVAKIVPEPSAAVLLATGAGLLFRRRRA